MLFQIVFFSINHEEWLMCKNNDMVLFELNYIVYFSVFSEWLDCYKGDYVYKFQFPLLEKLPVLI